jgi:hypothetical protein
MQTFSFKVVEGFDLVVITNTERISDGVYSNMLMH